MGSIRLSEDMKRVVREQGLGLSRRSGRTARPPSPPKGTTNVRDDPHLVFLHLNSPYTVANLRASPHVEVNVMDPIQRKEYRFAGTAEIFTLRDPVRRDPCLVRPGTGHRLPLPGQGRGADHRDRRRTAHLTCL